MRISDEQVTRLAELARLALDDGERARLSADLDQILAHFAELQALDTEGVPATAHALSLDCPLRSDEVAEGRDGASAASLLEAAPRAADGFFIVPRVIEGTE